MPKVRRNIVNQKDVARRIVMTREALNLTPTELAENLGISIQRLNNYESGRRPFDIDLAIALCDQWDVTLEWLYRGKRSGLSADLLAKLRTVERAGS